MSERPDERVVITFSRAKLAGLAFLALAACALFAYFIVFPYGSTRYPASFLQILGIFGIAFFGASFLSSIAKIVERRPGLVVDSRGLTLHGEGELEWQSVRGIRVVRIRMNRFLALDLHDPGLIVRRGNRVQRLLKAVNLRLCGSPIVFTSSVLDIDFDRMVRLLERYQEEAKRISAPPLSPGPPGV